ncbi:MAG: sugar phosphate isomerase/epimerase [Clostridia bacterium]|nr:sugar phosphate isomerase/epimerase [Clostridia bacterium]
MWRQKIGFSVGNGYSVPTEEMVKLVAEAGFDAVSPVWDYRVKLDPVIDAARACGLELQSLHAPFHWASKLWNDDEEISTPAKEELMRALEDCRRWEIPVMVMHAWIGFGDEVGSVSAGLKNYGELIDRAEQYGIRLAFENTEGLPYLETLLEHFKDRETVGFCWDSGHEMCYNYSEDLLAKFGDRLYMTHLNDNLGISRFDGEIYWTDDLHLLPYDGIADWEVYTDRMAASRRMEILNFELKIDSIPDRHENDVYMQMGLRQYLAEAYKRACRVAYRYAQKKIISKKYEKISKST